MIILDATTKTLEIDLAGAITTSQLPVVVSYADVTTTAYTPASTDMATNSTTAVTIVAAPAASTQRQVKLLTVYNADTATATVTVQLNNNGTLRPLVVVTLAVGSTLIYTDGEGWRVLTSAGAIVQSTLSPMTSAQLAAILSDETGTGLAVFATSPTFVTPALGAATATSINGLGLVGSGFTLTVPVTGTAALLGTANVFTATQTIPAIVSPAALIITPASGAFEIWGATPTDVLRVVRANFSSQYVVFGGTGNIDVVGGNPFQILIGGSEKARVDATSGHLLLNTTTDSAQLTVQSAAADTIGLVVNSAASATANLAEFRNNGTAKHTIGPNGEMTLTEQTAPSAPAANGGILYLEDDGAGKTRLMILFSSGASQQIAIQP